MKRTLDLDTLVLDSGSHDPDEVDVTAERAMCVMEAVAYVAGEEWSDSPQCASPVIAAFCRSWNDTEEPYGAEIRERLKAYIPRLVGSRGTPGQEERRAWLATDWLIRVCTPAWLRLAGLTEHADALPGLPPQTSAAAVEASAAVRAAAWDAVRDAASAAAWDAVRDAVRAAARAAAWDAASDAASAAVRDAAWAAVRDAVSDAAWDAASAAAWAAASDAAWAAAWDTMEALQASAWALLDAMLAVTE